jgi:hypothetical protein
MLRFCATFTASRLQRNGGISPFFMHGRGERIRTSGPCLPKTVLYQAELLPDGDPAACKAPGKGRPDEPSRGPIGVGFARFKRPV